MNTAVRVGRQRSPVPVLPVARLYTALILAAPQLSDSIGL